MLPSAEEKARVIPVIEAVTDAFPNAVVSVDTYKAEVAEAAISAGARMVNDITAFRGDDLMPSVVADAVIPIVLMHSVGKPGEMPHEHIHRDVVAEVKASLESAVRAAESHGIDDIIVDPGFGFGKSVSDNLRLVAELSALYDLGRPILVSLSRKLSIGVAIGRPGNPRPVNERLYGSLAGAAAAIMNGASIVRTHDVRPTRDVAEFLHALETTHLETGEVVS